MKREIMLATVAIATILAGGDGWAQPRPGGGQGGYQGQGGPGGGQGGGQGAAPAPAPTRPTGSFEASCRNVQVQGPNVTAECRNIHSRYPISTINFTACRGDLSNNNGVLSCAGAQATVPPGQDDGSGERRGNNNGQIAGALLGALAGGGNAGPSPQPPPPPPSYRPGDSYPAYGDSHYGDPRFDPRYGAQGWGYGHRPGEWVWIRQRADWLNYRIDRAVMAGYMGRREAGGLRHDLAALEGLEDRYRNQGMAPWMREDLDRRFDALADRVNNTPPPRPDYDRYRDGPPPPGYYGR